MKKVICVIFALFLFIVMNQNVYALSYIKSSDLVCTETKEYIYWKSLSNAEKRKVIEPIRCQELISNKSSMLLSNTGALVNNIVGLSYFNLANFDGTAFNGKSYVTTTKNQMIGSTETSVCWAFSSLASIESAYLIQHGGQNYNATTNTIDYSEKHMAINYLPTIGAYTNSYGFVDRTDWKTGGNIPMISAYFANLRGPVLESSVPFNLEAPTASQVQTTASLQVKNSIWSLNASCQDGDTINKMKQLLVTNGALYSTTYAGIDASTFLSTDKLSYYCPACGGSTGKPAGHAITIVGWDDNYDADNFNKLTDSNNNIYEPAGDGAWIVRNTYSDLFPGGGNTPENYYYVSYYDTLICNQVMSFEGITDDLPDNMYTYSKLGYNTNFSTNYSYVLYKNVYDKNTTASEMLTSVTTLGYEAGDTYEMYFADGDESDLSEARKIAEGTIPYLGYVNVDVQNSMITQDEFTIFLLYRPKSATCENGAQTCDETDLLYSYPIQNLPSTTTNTYYVSNPVHGKTFYSFSGSTWIDSTSSGNISFYPIINSYTSTIDYNFVVGEDYTSTSTQLNLTDGGTLFIPISNLTNISSINDISLTIYKDADDVTNNFVVSTYTSSDEQGYKIELGENSNYGDLTIVLGYQLIDYSVDISIAKNNHILITSIEIQGESEVAIDGTLNLSAVITPSEPTNGVLTWSSSDNTIAEVNSNGTVSGKKAGSIVITASATDESGKSATKTIRVVDTNENTDHTVPSNNNQGKVNPATGSFISIILLGFVLYVSCVIFKKTKQNRRFL